MIAVIFALLCAGQWSNMPPRVSYSTSEDVKYNDGKYTKSEAKERAKRLAENDVMNQCRRELDSYSLGNGMQVASYCEIWNTDCTDYNLDEPYYVCKSSARFVLQKWDDRETVLQRQQRLLNEQQQRSQNGSYNYGYSY